RLRAPYAHAVEVLRSGAAPAPMSRGADGVWALTTAPLEPDFYPYVFREDGVVLLDPANPSLVPNLVSPSTLLHVPGPASLLWETNQVPHGTIHHEFYHSDVMGGERDFYVYTPPGYDPRSARHYPVLYLLHGYTDDASAWTTVGRANVILDNLIARGEAQPMIVAMPLGYGAPEVLKVGEYRAFADHALRDRNYARFRETLLGEVMPRVEGEYQTEGSREYRAIAGLSMGGAEALFVGLNDLGRFAWIGSFSGAIGSFHGEGPDNFRQSYPDLQADDNYRISLLWLACGREDGLHVGTNRHFDAWLKERGIRHTYVETGGEHTWMVWRRNLAAFAPLLFR
ncbi:MAG: alpha/beta hydrolase, partial [Opitutaceae bacterium]